MKEATFLQYAGERASLTPSQIEEILSKGQELLSATNLVSTLVEGGSLFFPHATILQCGDQIAAAVLASLKACRDSGKNQILTIGVLHGFKAPIYPLHLRERAGENLVGEPLRRIFGPELSYKECLLGEFSLDNFDFLLPYAAEWLKMDMPRVISRYPLFVSGNPESLPEIQDLKNIAKESIVVATADLYHHGIAYKLAPEKAKPISLASYDLARETIEGGLHLLAGDDLLAFRKYCWEHHSDARDVGQMLRFLLGPLKGYIRDLKLIDVEYLYENNTNPSWVAAALVELMRIS